MMKPHREKKPKTLHLNYIKKENTIYSITLFCIFILFISFFFE